MTKLVLFAAIASAVAFSGFAQAANPEAGKEKSRTCAACHGPDGNSPNPAYPRIAGQYESYLVKALHDYKSGARQNPIMAGIISGVDEKDFAAIAEYFSRQQALCTTDQIKDHGKCTKTDTN